MPAKRYNFAEAYMTRNGNSATAGTTDVYIKNGYIDKYGDNLYVMKRPGNVQVNDLGVTGIAQGAFYFNGSNYVIINDILYVTGSGVSTGTDGSAFTAPSVPVWTPRQAFTVSVFQNLIYVIGGITSTTINNSDISSSMDGVNWTIQASGAPFGARAYPSSCVFNGKLWVMGGADQISGVADASVWSTSNGVDWTQVTANAGWSPRLQGNLIAANGGMYFMAGNSYPAFTRLNDVWFTADGATWTQILNPATTTVPWVARTGSGLCFFNNKFYLIGGADAGGLALNDVWSSSDAINWTQTTSLAFASGRQNFGLTIYNNKIWVIGGNTNGGVALSDVYSSSDGTTFTLVTSSPGFSARYLLNAVVFPVPVTVNAFRYPTIYVMGGTTTGSNFLNDVYYGNINTQLQATYALTPTTAGQSYQFNTFVNGTYLLIKNQSNMWILSAGTLIKVTTPNYPAVTVPGLVVLNQFAYVMTPQGIIFASGLNDATLWPGAQFIAASYEDDPGVYLAKYLNYVTAIGQYTMQFFYDNANPPPGISISPYTNANIRVGSPYPQSVQNVENTIIFVGQTSNRNWGVYMLDGMNPKRVSTTWVDRLLNGQFSAVFYSMVTAIDGHTFYVLNLLAIGVALVYDIKIGQWYLWTGAVGSTAFPYTHALTNFSTDGDFWIYNGKIFQVQDFAYADNGVAFPLVVQTDKIDGDNLNRKFWTSLQVAADVNPAQMLVEYTDDDYQTYRRWGVISLNQMRPYINRGGSSRRRAFRFTQTDNNPARWQAMDINYTEGQY